MFELVILTALWSSVNTDYIKTTEEQYKQGYEWWYVGKQEASGSPAISIKPGNGKEIIFFRLED